MKVPSISNHPNIRTAYLEKFEKRELWHKLVVKILCWKDGLLEGSSINITNKITPKEWKTYYKKMVETNLIYGKEKALSNLKITKAKIEEHGGFDKSDLI